MDKKSFITLGPGVNVIKLFRTEFTNVLIMLECLSQAGLFSLLQKFVTYGRKKFYNIGPSEEMRCAYVGMLMAIYWVAEALPLPVTSLIPMVAFPLMGLMSTVKTFFMK